MPPETSGRAMLRDLWGRSTRVGTFVLVQVFVQALIAASGVVVVRQLAKADYALYTLAVSAITMLNILSDFGLSHAVIALGGKHFGSPDEVDAIVSAALRARRFLFIGTAAIIGSAVPFVLSAHGGTPSAICFIVAAVLAASWLQAGSSIFFGVLRIHHKLGLLQSIDVCANLLKIGLLILFTLGKLSLVACLIALVAGATLHYAYSRYSVRSYLRGHRATKAHYKILWAYCKPLIASAVFFTISGQITVWLLSVLSSTNSIAEIGALTRLSAVSTIFVAVMASLGMPYFAKLKSQAALPGRAASGGGLLLVGSAALMLSCWRWPMAWLFILGPRYANMTVELRYQVLSICIVMASTYCYSILAARGATSGQWRIIPATLVGIVLGALLSPPLDTVSAVRFQLFLVAPQFLVQCALLAAYLRRTGTTSAARVEDAVAVC